MAVIDLDQLSAGLGIPVDAADPIGSMKAVYEGLKAKADAAGAVDSRLGSIEEALKALENSGNPTPEDQQDKSDKADPDTGRQLQADLAAAKSAPSRAELSGILRRAPQDAFEKALHDFNDTCHLLAAVKRVPVTSLDFYKSTIEQNPAMAKLLTGLSSGGVGDGAEWVPQGFSGQIWEDVRLQTLVASNLITVNMPTESYILPYKSGTVSAYLTAELTDQTVSRMGSGKDTLTAVGIGAALWFSRNLAEDAIAPVMPLVRSDITMTIAEAIENAIINGDTTASHMDNDTTNALDPRKGFPGYRKLCLAAAATKLDASAFSTGTTVAATCRAMRKKMGKYGINPADLMWLTGPSGYSQFLAAPEVLTMDKYGPQATIMTGELARFDGIPVVISGQVREDLDNTGVNSATPGNNVKTSLSLINKRMGIFGVYKTLMIEDDVFILSDSILVVGKTRVDFKPRVEISATHPAAILGYNVAS